MKTSALSEARHGTLTSVSVVVPTIGRPELLRALRSVRAQHSGASIELIVVHDGEAGAKLPPQVAGLADRVLRTAGRVGGGHARNLGIASAKHDLVALLDDDDEWLSNKLEVQLSLMRSVPDPARTVVSGRQVYVNPHSDAESRPSPKRLIADCEPVEHYLFRRRPPLGGRPMMTTSTLLFPRELAVSTPWDESLTRHQDWDWLVRLGRMPGTAFAQTPEAVARIHLGSALSISATTDWRASLNWANQVLRTDAAVYADFVAAQPLRYALAARSWTGFLTVLTALRSTRQVPSAGPVAIGIAGLLPRRVVERVTVATAGARQPFNKPAEIPSSSRS